MKVIAILCSDIHLQEKPPVARSAEPDWFEAMKRPLTQIARLKLKYGVPVIYAGDLFNRWNPPPELINWAMDYVPEGFAIPGQHDLPFHNYDDMGRSGYWTLCKCKVLTNLEPTKYWALPGLRIWGFPWGHEISPMDEPKIRGVLDLAVIHAYVWRQGASYPGADEEKRVGVYASKLKGYDAAVFGDNHIGFTAVKNGINIMNCGTLMRRTIAEDEYRPMIGLLMEDGTIDPYYLDVSVDKMLPREDAKLLAEAEFKMESFLKELESLGKTDLDFTESLKAYLDTYKVSKEAETILLQALDHATKS